MFESINTESSTAVFVQIENLVQFAIAAGRIRPGDKLPAVRELAEKLNVNFNTVTKSYHDLVLKGLVCARRGTGYFVNKSAQVKCREEIFVQLASRLHEVVAEAKAAGMTAKEIKGLTAKCYLSAEEPYAPPPRSLFDLAKAKKK